MALDDYLKSRRGVGFTDLNLDDEEIDSEPNPYLEQAMRAATASIRPRTPVKTKTTPTRSGRGVLAESWRTLTSPLRALSGVTGSLGGLVAREIDPEGYEAASRELEADELAGETRDLSVIEEAGALPGLGDVLAQNISPDGVAGRIVRPVAQIAGNIIGDPTSYVGVGLIPKLVTGTGRVARTARGVEALGRTGATGRAVREAVAAPSRGKRAAAVAKVAATIPFGPTPAIPYIPEAAEAVVGGVQRTFEDLKAGNPGLAAASGIGTLMTSALSLLVSRGLVDEARAASALDTALSDAAGVKESAATTADMADEPELVMPTAPPPVKVPRARTATAPVTPPTTASSTPPPMTATHVTPAPPPEVTARGEVVPPAGGGEAPRVEPETLKPKVSDDKIQALNELIEELASTGQQLTKKTLIERGFVTAGQAKNPRMEKLVGSELMKRLEPTTGGGYKVKARVVEGAEDEVEVPTAPVEVPVEPVTSPAPAPAPAPQPRPATVPRTEIRRQLDETPGLLEKTDQTLGDIATERGKSLEDMGPQDIREAFPGDHQKPVRALLNDRLARIKKDRKDTAAKAVEAREVVEPMEAVEAITTAAETPRTPPAPIPFPPREGPRGLDLFIPRPSPEPYRTSGRDAGIEDSGVTRRETAIRAGRATAPGAAPPTRPPVPVAAEDDVTASTPTPLTPELSAKLGARLAGGSDLLRPSPDSPIGAVLRQRPLARGSRQRPVAESEVYDAASNWLELATKDPAELNDVERRIRHLLIDEPNDATARTELTKLLSTAAQNLSGGGAKTAARRAEIIGAGSEGEWTVAREKDVADLAADGLAPAEAQRMAITRPAGLREIEALIPEADPEYPARPAGFSDDDWRAKLRESPEQVRDYRRALAWAQQEWESNRSTGAARSGMKDAATPWMDVARGIARDLGLRVDPRRGFDRVAKRVAKELSSLAGDDPTPRASFTDLLTDQLVKERGDAWRGAINRGRTIGDTGTRAVDLEGDAADLVGPVSTPAFAPLADRLARGVADLGDLVQLPSRFDGFALSPQLNGVRIGDGIYLNPVEAYARAKAQGLSGDQLTYATARDITDTALHEIAHKKARHEAATGDQTFIDAYAQALEDAGPMYAETIRQIQEVIDPRALDPLVPIYTRSQEAVRARVQGAGAGAGARRIAPIPGGPRRDPRGAVGGAQPGVRPGRVVPGGREGGQEGRGAVGDAAAAREGAAGGAARGGEGEPNASLTATTVDHAARALDTHRAQTALDVATRRTEKVLAESIARYAGRPDDSVDEIIQQIEKVRSLPAETREKLRSAGPGEAFDIGTRLSKYADALSDEQLEQMALIQLVHRSEQPRSTPMSFEKMDAEGRALLSVQTPEQFVALTKSKGGPKTVADFAALRTALATFGEDVDRAYASIRSAEVRKDQAALDVARENLAHAWLRRNAAVSVLVPATTNTARELALHRMLVHPLEPEERFQGRFFGAMKAAKIPDEKTKQLWSMFQDTLEADRKHGAGAGDWSRFASAFRDAVKPKLIDRFLEFWKAGLLGIPTQIANVGSNAAYLALRNIEQGTSAMANVYLDKVTGGPRTRYLSEVAGRQLGLRFALRDLLPIVKDDLTDIARLAPPDIGKRLERGSFQDDPNLRQLHGAIGGSVGEFVRIPFKLLDAADNVFKHIARMQEYGAWAARIAQEPEIRAKMGNASPTAAAAQIFNEIRRYSQDPITNRSILKGKGEKFETMLKAAIESGRKTMLEDTFQAPLGDTMRKLHQGTQAHPALQFLFPFVKAPYNLLAEGMKRTPLGAMHAIKKYSAGEFDRPEFVQAMVKSAMGSLIMGTVAGMALEGTITGGGPTDPKQVELLKRTGWQPYSIKADNQYISYQRIEPFATLLGIAADLAEAWQRKDIDSANELMEKFVASGSENVLSKSFLTGLESIVKIATDAGGGRSAAIRQLQASLVPNIIGVVPVAHAARAVDPVYRETEAFTASPMLAQIPGASTLLPPQYSPTGEPRERKGSAFERLVSPFARSESKDDPIAKVSAELVRLGRSIERPPLFFRVGNERIYYTPEERQELARTQERSLVEMAKAMQRGGYDRLPDRESVEGGGRETTKADVLMRVRSKVMGSVQKRMDRQALMRARAQSARAQSTSERA